MTNPVRQNVYLVASATGTIYPTVVFNRPPATTDFNYPVTQRWIDTSGGNAEWFLLGFTSSAGVVSPNWVKLAAGSLTAESLTGNSGAAVFPDGSFNINVLGDSSGIQFAGNPGTHTLTASLASIPNSSLANSSITLVAGTGISITTSPVSLGGSTTISSTLTLPAFDKVVVQVFTGNGTYTPTSGMKYCTIEVVGGGGGSGGCASTDGSSSSSAGGGGGGGYARKTVTAATIGSSQTVTVGAAGTAGTAGANTGGTGGTTSVGSIVSATGGLGGSGGLATTTISGGTGGAGGAGSSGDFNTNGTPGGYAIATGTTLHVFSFGGTGGSSFFGGASPSVFGASAAVAAVSYGGGGTGGSNGPSSSSITGAAGFAGIVVITEFVSV